VSSSATIREFIWTSFAPRDPHFWFPFRSRFAGESGQIRVYSQLPNTTLESVANLTDFCGVFVADRWLGNTDYRQAIFTRSPGVSRQLSFVVQMIDTGQMFDGENWRFEDSPIRRPYFGTIFQNVYGIGAFEPWLAAVAAFPQAVLEGAFQQMPPTWRSAETETAFEKLLGQLMRRRERVSDWIYECHALSSNPFPNYLSRSENRPIVCGLNYPRANTPAPYQDFPENILIKPKQ